MIVKQSIVVFLAAAVVISFCAAPSSAGPPAKAAIPDFTEGGQTDGSHDWTLGPTGARGWIHAWKHTADARQILITKVAKGSPADGVLDVNDVLLGVENRPFSDDARIQFARAVMRAEQLYPFPEEELRGFVNEFPNATEVVWCQEEPQNQGAWYQIRHHLQACISKQHELKYVGRPHSASPAVGSYLVHVEEQKALVTEAILPSKD